MKILYLEDHAFFGDSIIAILKKDFPQHTYDYATSYIQAVEMMKNNKYDVSILDVILQNGKTGIHFAENYTKDLGHILFVTGCKDDLTLKALEKYNHVAKDITVLSDIKSFIRTYDK